MGLVVLHAGACIERRFRGLHACRDRRPGGEGQPEACQIDGRHLRVAFIPAWAETTDRTPLSWFWEFVSYIVDPFLLSGAWMAL